MNRISLIVATLALTALSVHGQTQASSSCKLAIAQAPAIRGVKLGMKVDEVLALFPGSAEKDQIKSAIAKAEDYPNFGIASIFVGPREYSTKERFAGIADFRFTFLDGRVHEYEVEYDSPPGGPVWRRVDDWITKLVDAFGLPAATDWVGDQNLSDRKSLKCDGFRLVASNMNLRGNLSVSSLETPFQKQQERKAVYEEKLRREFKP